MKTIFTFGSSHLKWMKHKLNPMKVALVIEADNVIEARNIVFESRIGEYFCSSYSYSKLEHLKNSCSMAVYTLDELDANTKENSISAIEEKILAKTENLYSCDIRSLSLNDVFISTSTLTPNPAVHNVDNLFLEKAILKLLDSGWDAHPFSV